MLASVILASTVAIVNPGAEPTSWLESKVTTGESASLTLASRRYVSETDGWPEVWLVGVTHIGDESFYDAVGELVADSDLVLYESVYAEVTLPPSGDTIQAQQNATSARLEWLAEAARACGGPDGDWPGSMDELQAKSVHVDRRMVDSVRSLRHDAWGHPVVLLRNGNTTVVRSYGADGRPGGEDAAEDLEVTLDLGEGSVAVEGIQESLARGLDLEFQLKVLPYEREDWQVSDMSWEALSAAFQESGVEIQGLSGMLEGSSLPAGIAKLFLRLLPALDVLTGGAVTDGVKVMLIELLGNDQAVEIATREFGADVGRILIDERNIIVINDLVERSQVGDVDRIAVVYGAGHMADMGERLEALGWTEQEVRWLPAITVDLEKSSLTKAHMMMIRRSVDMAMKRLEQRSAPAPDAE
ncbi:MAG: type II secretion system protein GspG [Phycisphaerales bacterium]|nr:type II secretion system protein GspG [Phycisphaerales bacterium]